MLTYRWKDGFEYHAPIEASIVGERLRYLSQSLGRIVEAEEFLADATPEDSPTHPAFLWDDAREAHLFRLEQSRRLIRNVIEIRVETPDDAPQEQPLMVHVQERIPGNGGPPRLVHGYMLTEDAKRAPEIRETVVARLTQELLAWVKKAEEYREFRPMLRAMRPFLPGVAPTSPRARRRPAR